MNKDRFIAFCGVTMLVAAVTLVGQRTTEGKPTHAAGRAPTVRPDGAGRVAFVSTRSGNADIYVMRPDGSDIVNLTNHLATDRYPAWSPDGRKIAFQSTRDGNFELYVMNDDGSDVVRLTFDLAPDTLPWWTPDGTIIFSSRRSGRYELYEMNADGSGLRHIEVVLDGDLLHPRVSPEGHRISFFRQTFNGFDIESAVWIAHRDGSHAKQLTPDELHAAAVSWSPRGINLAFANNYCYGCGASHILTMNQDGELVRQLTDDPGENDLFPSWSPDGSQIVFERWTLSTLTEIDIYVMNADGSGVTNISQNPGPDYFPVWGP